VPRIIPTATFVKPGKSIIVKLTTEIEYTKMPVKNVRYMQLKSQRNHDNICKHRCTVNLLALTMLQKAIRTPMKQEKACVSMSFRRNLSMENIKNYY